MRLPTWLSALLDWVTEEYAKLTVRLQTRKHYDRIVVLEDERATAVHLWHALLVAGASGATVVDVLMLVHGQPGYACGYKLDQVGPDFFDGLRRLQAAGVVRLNLRAVYQMNCYGETLAGEWLSLGAQAVNGSIGINWLPEPSLSLFLNHWLRGNSFGQAVDRSYQGASRLLGLVWRPRYDADGRRHSHDKIASSQMLVFGDRELGA